jgi:TRAP-type mannitol/chloroaromatic compound transport system substrate-binding protein
MISRRSLLGAAGLSAVAAPAMAAEPVIRWRMATSWPKTLVGPGTSAQRLAQRINQMSGGRMQVDVFAAGEIVPAFAVFDSVANGVVEMGHTASFFIIGKVPAASFFTTVPFGLNPVGHAAWLSAGGGQELWDRLYAPFGVKAFLGGNTGPSLAGWFRKPPQGLDDLKGLRIRVSGLGGEVYRRLGAVPQAIPPGDVYPSLERGTIDAVELLGPMNDSETGLWRIAPVCMVPGFNKPNGASEALVSLKAWQALPADLKAMVENACQAEHATALAEAELAQGVALRGLIGNGARIVAVPRDILSRARAIATEILDETGASSPLAQSILESYRAAQAQIRPWERVTRLPQDEG